MSVLKLSFLSRVTPKYRSFSDCLKDILPKLSLCNFISVFDTVITSVLEAFMIYLCCAVAG